MYPTPPPWRDTLTRGVLGGLPNGAARERWRRRGEAALALEFLKARASGEDHPLDVAEKYQHSEGFDDLGDARDAIV
eukprot:15423-Pyramimonas_sp.AAC.1